MTGIDWTRAAKAIYTAPTMAKPSVWDRYARGLYSVIKGDRKRRLIVTPIAAIIFFGVITFFVIASFWVDRWLNLPYLPAVWWRYLIAAVVFVAGIVLGATTVTRFFLSRGTPVPTSPPPKLITTGLYSYIRNPMALGALLILEGLGFYYGSPSLIVFFAPLPIVLYGFYIKAVEEPELTLRFGREYLEYKKKVPMFIPKFRRQI
jgi:protein-S-isoprenylcysteine O-methyltransferase Ste14